MDCFSILTVNIYKNKQGKYNLKLTQIMKTKIKTTQKSYVGIYIQYILV